jgi:predicted trehalose synthase
MAVTPTSGFLSALLSVPASAWRGWFAGEAGEHPFDAPPRQLVATFGLPYARGEAALCLFEVTEGPDAGTLEQVALRRWIGAVPEAARLLYVASDATDRVLWAIGSAWVDDDARAWFREALSAGALLRSEGWEWHAVPERPAALRGSSGGSRVLQHRRHDVIIFEPGAVAVSYRRLTRGGQPELDLLRHLAGVPGVKLTSALLGSAIIRSPSGQKTASALLEELQLDAATAHDVVVSRLRRSLDADPSLQASALEDVRAAGVTLRELHGALGRSDGTLLQAATSAAESDVEVWTARAWGCCTAAREALVTFQPADTALLDVVAQLPARLQQFGAAAARAPGLLHRIHGDFRLLNVLMSPPRRMRVVELDGDPGLPDAERVAPQSPWRDVAQLRYSVATAAAAAAELAGGDAKAFEIAWLWEREARNAVLEGYGAGGGAALHALLAIFELEFASRDLRLSLATGRQLGVTTAAHALHRLMRTVV